MRHPLDGQVLKTIETDLWICAEYKASQVQKQQHQNTTKCIGIYLCKRVNGA